MLWQERDVLAYVESHTWIHMFIFEHDAPLSNNIVLGPIGDPKCWDNLWTGFFIPCHVYGHLVYPHVGLK